jgi:hypothetical protein
MNVRVRANGPLLLVIAMLTFGASLLVPTSLAVVRIVLLVVGTTLIATFLWQQRQHR